MTDFTEHCTTANGQMQAAIINKMQQQLSEVLAHYKQFPPSNVSTASREKMLREMNAQHTALGFAYQHLVRAYGEPPVDKGFRQDN